MIILNVVEGLGEIVSKLSFLKGEKVSESIYKNQFHDLKSFTEQNKKNVKYFDDLKKIYYRLLCKTPECKSSRT